MRITEITLKFDTGGSLEYQDPTGFNLADILGIFGIHSLDNIVDAEQGTWQAAINNLIKIVLGVLMKRFGI